MKFGKCVACGIEFYQRGPKHLTCSSECRVLARRLGLDGKPAQVPQDPSQRKRKITSV